MSNSPSSPPWGALAPRGEELDPASGRRRAGYRPCLYGRARGVLVAWPPF